AERHGFEYYRHGTLSLYAALDTATGRVHGKTARRHTSRDFVVFLKEVVALCPPDQQIHIILDNLSAHKTAQVQEFLEQHPRVRFHFTPPTPHGSTKSSYGSPKSNGRSSPAASLPPCPIWLASSAATSTLIQPMLGPFTGSTPIRIRNNDLSATRH
ncbi:MAG TPA: transposase, partial [Edaphobacter sp.]|nr:transposase [Edaphobacter sp.]